MGMGFDEIVIVEGGDLDTLLAILHESAIRLGLARRLRFVIDEGGIKFKINDGTWTPAFGVIEGSPVHRDNIERR